MKRDTHEVFCEAFKNLGIDLLRLIVGHRKSPPLQQELIRKRPNKRMMAMPDNSNRVQTDHRETLTTNQTLLTKSSHR